MERLKNLKSKDVRTAHSFIRVLNLLGISEEDLLLLKEIKNLKQEIENLSNQLYSLQVGLGLTVRNETFNTQEGEHLLDE